MTRWRVALFALGSVLLLLPVAAHAQPVTLQSLVDAAAPGATVPVPPGVYRETVTLNKPLTLDGQGTAEIRGSDVWTAWTQNGTTWTSANNVPTLGDETPYLSDGRCPSSTAYACIYREQVFSDGVPLQEIAPNTTPASGQFSLNSMRQMVLADNPNGHTLEVTVRPAWIVTNADNVTIRGFSMRHAASPAQWGGVSNNGHAGWTLQNNTLALAHGEVVAITGGTGVHVTGNDISGGGEAGIGGYSTGALIQSNTIHDNGAAFSSGWAAAGIKLDGSNNTLDGNELAHNPVGAWQDIASTNWSVTNNRVHDNGQMGILDEISDGATITSNAVWNNGWSNQSWGWGAGILVQTSGGATVANNTVAWNYAGISVIDLTRSDAPPSLDGNSVHDNIVVRQESNLSSFWANQQLFANDDQGGVTTLAHPVSFAHNLLWMDYPEAYPPELYTYANVAWWQLSDWAAHTGDTTSRYLSDAEAYAALTAAHMPTGPIPAPATVTPTSTATATPVPTSTPTPRPTSTPVATATPVCQVLGLRNGQPAWIHVPC